jgi:hypothetical protein
VDLFSLFAICKYCWKIADETRNALQYDIGNPLTASLMTRHQIAAALYPPIRVVLYDNDAGHGVFEYDQPSTTFGQFDHRDSRNDDTHKYHPIAIPAKTAIIVFPYICSRKHPKDLTCLHAEGSF